MKITVTTTVDIPDCLDEGSCRRWSTRIDDDVSCQFVDFYNVKCTLFGEDISWFKKCKPCLEAHRGIK